ncbi:MAG: (2Fe-2S)-binding protein [Caldilineaceae bacterium]|nr:(2Fe-2S)-binding protein [Caldilineaceae bacterium]
MQLTINGESYDVADNPNAPILWALRDELGLTGTKFGCGVGICGACTIHIDGVVTRACITPLAAAEGREIRTIEGLADTAADGSIILHPVQQAFIEEQVPQCGWCMSGQIMTAVAFLAQNPTPNDEEIVNAMGNNYCRCGCYVRIKRAVKGAAEQLASLSHTVGAEVTA